MPRKGLLAAKFGAAMLLLSGPPPARRKDRGFQLDGNMPKDMARAVQGRNRIDLENRRARHNEEIRAR